MRHRIYFWIWTISSFRGDCLVLTRFKVFFIKTNGEMILKFLWVTFGLQIYLAISLMGTICHSAIWREIQLSLQAVGVFFLISSCGTKVKLTESATLVWGGVGFISCDNKLKTGETDVSTPLADGWIRLCRLFLAIICLIAAAVNIRSALPVNRGVSVWQINFFFIEKKKQVRLQTESCVNTLKWVFAYIYVVEG